MHKNKKNHAAVPFDTAAAARFLYAISRGQPALLGDGLCLAAALDA